LTAAVVQRKLAAPPLAERFAQRPRVDALIGALVETRRTVVVSAAAGSGKSSALVAATAKLDRPVAWLTVSQAERAPGRLVTYLEAAIAGVAPRAGGVATDALSHGVPHSEAVGILAERVAGERLLLILDELERLSHARGAWKVIEALVRYFPSDGCLVLVSRDPVSTGLCELPARDEIGYVGGDDLAFTHEEAAAALARVGKSEVDPTEAVASTDGWVTGVLFRTQAAGRAVSGLGRETDPLYDYLSSEILDQLAAEDRHFLIATAVLDEVTPVRAAGLGFADGGTRLEALRETHLPATWDSRTLRLRCHSYFREYLLERLGRLDRDFVRSIHVAHARLLVSDGHDEDAVEEFLEAGARGEALEPATRTIVAVVDRLDFEVADRWLDALGRTRHGGPALLATAEMMLAIARNDISAAVRVADCVAELGERVALVHSSERAAWLMLWGYIHRARFEDVDAILGEVQRGPARHALRYALSTVKADPDDPPSAPERSGGPLDALIAVADYGRGRLHALSDAPPSRWVEALELPWRIGALRALGRTRDALELLEAALDSGSETPALLAWTGPEVLIDAGRRDDALELLRRGRRIADATGSVIYSSGSRVVEAKLALRLDHDAPRAKEILASQECAAGGAGIAFIGEVVDTWLGLALLQEGQDAAALRRLRRAVTSMLGADRILELPTAAVYLAEAQSRAGHDQAASRAAATAVEAAGRQGSNHLLLQALADFPAVCAREVEAEQSTDATWSTLGSALRAQRTTGRSDVTPVVVLQEFGRRALTVDGKELKPRISKSYELLAYLTQARGRRLDRDTLLDALFGERRDASARSYLRQAVQWLRQLLPEGTITSQEGSVTLDEDAGVVSESMTFEQRLAEAARLQDGARLDATVAALAIHDRGEYLPGDHGAWADDRARHLDELATEARYEAAVLALGAGRYDDADRWITEVLRQDPFREPAWRVAMRIAHATGDEAGLLRRYRSCEQALAPLRLNPGPATTQLLGRLRR